MRGCTFKGCTVVGVTGPGRGTPQRFDTSRSGTTPGPKHCWPGAASSLPNLVTCVLQSPYDALLSHLPTLIASHTRYGRYGCQHRTLVPDWDFTRAVQTAAKRAVATALRNRWRRQQLNSPMKVLPSATLARYSYGSACSRSAFPLQRLPVV